MNWSIWIVRGIASIVFGVLTWLLPLTALAALVLVFGFYAIVDGVTILALAWRIVTGRWAYIVRGVLGIAAGVVTFMWPVATAISLYVLIGVWALACGVMEIAASIMLSKRISQPGMLAFTGVVTSIFGVILLARPLVGVTALLGLVIAYAFVHGIGLIGVGLRIHQLFPRRPAGNLAEVGASAS